MKSKLGGYLFPNIHVEPKYIACNLLYERPFYCCAHDHFERHLYFEYTIQAHHDPGIPLRIVMMKLVIGYLNWFSSYLSNRRQAVRINSALSEKLTVHSGFQQGSILGPILFSIYVNDLPAIPQHCSSKVFVADNKLNYIHLFLFNNVNLQ